MLIGLIENGPSLRTINLHKEPIEEKSYKDFHEIQTLNLDLAIFSQDTDLAQIQNILEAQGEHYPIISNQKAQIDLNDSQLIKGARNQLESTLESWYLKNNLKLIENLVPTSTHLHSLWKNDRYNFFEELMAIIQKNIRAQGINIYFHDVKEFENDKKELGHSVIKSSKKPQIFFCQDELDKKLTVLEENLTEKLEVIHSSQEGLYLGVLYNQSPVLIHLDHYQLSPLTKSLMIGLFSF